MNVDNSIAVKEGLFKKDGNGSDLEKEGAPVVFMWSILRSSLTSKNLQDFFLQTVASPWLESLYMSALALKTFNTWWRSPWPCMSFGNFWLGIFCLEKWLISLEAHKVFTLALPLLPACFPREAKRQHSHGAVNNTCRARKLRGKTFFRDCLRKVIWGAFFSKILGRVLE